MLRSATRDVRQPAPGSPPTPSGRAARRSGNRERRHRPRQVLDLHRRVEELLHDPAPSTPPSPRRCLCSSDSSLSRAARDGRVVGQVRERDAPPRAPRAARRAGRRGDARSPPAPSRRVPARPRRPASLRHVAALGDAVEEHVVDLAHLDAASSRALVVGEGAEERLGVGPRRRLVRVDVDADLLEAGRSRRPCRRRRRWSR